MLLGAARTLCALQTPNPAPLSPAAASPVIDLYHELRTATLDPAQIYRVRELTIDREDLHVYFTDGTLAFTKAVDGHITGAFFEGHGEVLVRPPDPAERSSLGLFTGLGVLDDQFTTAFLRFTDDVYNELRPRLQPADNAKEFFDHNEPIVQTLAYLDSLRLLNTYTSKFPADVKDSFLHARIAGSNLGVYDVAYDSLAEEQIAVARMTSRGDANYYDIWMSFPGRRARMSKDANRVINPWKSSEAAPIESYRISAELIPPQEIDADAHLRMRVRQGGQRLLYFQLSRYLQVKEARADGQPVQILQNESVSGSELARQGNDEVVLVFPEPLRSGQSLDIEMKYRGNVMEQAGAGLLYVGARGTWFPNRGMAFANFDLQFRWPGEWTLVATGKRVSLDTLGSQLVGRWVSETPIPLAGFNLGQYTRKSTKAGPVTIDSYATRGMEYSFAQRVAPSTIPVPGRRPREDEDTAVVMPPVDVKPLQMGQTVADRSAQAVQQYSQWFGPYPYSSLSLTQFPGPSSQGWPGLIFLSGMVFLTPEEKVRLNMDDFTRILYGDLMQNHETAHQWWGSVVSWRGYRDQWLLEALANYSALMLLEHSHPADFHTAIEYYRNQLLRKNDTGRQYLEAGPVTLGLRLSSSQFPAGYQIISYGRGTWLFHMLRHMLRDAVVARGGTAQAGDELFLHALHTLRDRFSFKQMTTRDVLKVFEEVLPDSLKFENSRSLDWFYDGWVNGTAIPRYMLADVKFAKGAVVHASFTLKQEEAPSELVTSIPIYAVVGGASQPVFVARVFADGTETQLRLRVPSGTRKLIVDPYQTVLSRK